MPARSPLPPVSRRLLATGAFAWACALALRHWGAIGDAAAGFGLGFGVALQVGALLAARRRGA